MRHYNSDVGQLGAGQSFGMDGTATSEDKRRILNQFWELMGGEYEFVDMGASSGVMLFMARAMGAGLAVGIECRSSGLVHVFDLAREIASGQAALKRGRKKEFLDEGHCISASSVHLGFGQAVGRASPTGEWSVVDKLPSLQEEGSSMPVGVFAFCDGWAEEDRVQLFQMVGKASAVRVFMCSPGKGTGEVYTTPEKVLAAMNAAASAQQLPLFSLHSKLHVHMARAKACKGKTLFVMLRS
jgi:hypothetical protein